jgi:anionic cell wall polymer biosynthesis LytR-Cps2A-Psr (LCP) family protein
MKDKRPSIDGFVPRRPGSQLGELHDEKARISMSVPVDRSLHSGDNIQAPLGVARPGKGVGRSDIDDSLREIDDGQSPAKQTRRQRKIAKKNKPRSKAKKIIKRVIIILVIILVGIAGYFAYQTISKSGNIFKGSLFDVLTQTSQPLQEDSNGRSNILILGTSQDDPGHDAGNLTDSMMILSIDQKNKNAYMVSIPRDLYVNYELPCASGYSGKINVYYSCVTNGTSVDDQRAALTKTADFVGTIFGMKIQYGVNVDYTVFRDVVNAIGGSITVTIAGDGDVPEGVPAGSVMDSNFDWKCGATYSKRIANCPPDGHYIEYTAGTHVIDAEHALYLAQARGDVAPTYGFAQSNFDREKNQQMIVKAVRDKALSSGVLLNPAAVNNIIDSLGDNLHTTFQANEIKTLISLAQTIKDSNINSLSLVGGDSAIMTTETIDGAGSVVIPSAGEFDYSALQAYLQQKLSSNPVVREAAPIAVYNGSDVSGIAQNEATTLQNAGYTIETVGSAPDGTYPAVTLYQIGTGNSGTKAALQKLLGVTAKTTAPPMTVDGATDFVIILGAAPTTNQ